MQLIMPAIGSVLLVVHKILVPIHYSLSLGVQCVLLCLSSVMTM